MGLSKLIVRYAFKLRRTIRNDSGWEGSKGMAKKGSARAVRLVCPKCTSKFTVVAFVSQTINAIEYWRERAEQHDCDAHAKALASARSGDGTKNPLKASKAAARGKK
jgi:hypothetical protein